MFGANARRVARAAVLAGAWGATAGCFQTTAPRGWLATPEEASHQAYGSWVRLEDRSKGAAVAIEGELIAVDRDTIHVLSFARLMSVPRASVCCVTLTAFRMDYGTLAAWGVVGTVSTLSHGFGLILTAPIWAITATSAAAAASRAPRIQSTDPEVLRRFARFPQGMPAVIDRATLRPKPWPIAPTRNRESR